MAIIPSTAKVLNQYNNVNTTYGGSEAMKAQSKWYTMQDVTDTVRPYQVFTALLTQSGGDEPSTMNSGYLKVGRTYTIQNVGRENFDFTNVGAPNNDPGTSFMATGEVPNSWGTGGDPIDLLEYNTGAPMAIVLENTIGNVWFTYTDVGQYQIDSNALFIDDKSFTLIGSRNIDAGDSSGPNGSFVLDSSSIRIYTLNDSLDTQNNNLNSTPIEIRVYN
jgi:hypothetical protein